MSIKNSNLFFLLSFFLLIFAACQTEGQTQKPDKKTEIPPADSIVRIRISAVGDLMCHSTQYNYAALPGGGFDFVPVFEPVADYLRSADLTTGNLETVLAGKTRNYGGYPSFNTPNEYADGLKTSGFDCIITSNNHSLDQGEAGILRTLDELQKRDLPTIGTYRSPADQDSVRIFERSGIRIAVLAYTQFSNAGYPGKKYHLLSLLDSGRLENDVKQARQKGAEIVLLNIHWGAEYQREPSDYQRTYARFAASLGVDALIGHHPHVIQPAEMLPGKNGPMFTAYSLGNFYSNQRWRYSDSGLIVSLFFEKNKNTGKVKAAGSEFVPTWLFKGPAGGKNSYIVLPSALHESDSFPDFLQHLKAEEFKFLSPTDRKLMKQADEDSREILGRYGYPVKIGLWKKDKKLPELQFLPPIDSLRKVSFKTGKGVIEGE